MKRKIYTKEKMACAGWRFKHSDIELLRAAAELEETTMSDFLRRALRERARRVLDSAKKPGA